MNNTATNKKVAVVGNGTAPILGDIFSTLSRNGAAPICVNDNQDVLGRFASLGYQTMSLGALKDEVGVDVIFVAIQPSTTDGEIDITKINAAAAAIAEGFLKKHRGNPLIVFAGMTFPVGTIDNGLSKILSALSQKTLGKSFNIAYVPQLITDNDLIVVGGLKKSPGKILEDLLAGYGVLFNHVSPKEAEMLQSAKEFFKANQKVAFDEIARICVRFELDYEEIFSQLGLKQDWEKSAEIELKNNLAGLTSFVSMANKLNEPVPLAETIEAIILNNSPTSSSVSKLPTAGRKFTAVN